MVHLATCKETPDVVIDVTVKGLFWLLEAFRTSPAAKQFILIGGDAGIGHFFYAREAPVTETTPHAAYPGCYALSKVLEEVVVEQFGIQYGIDWCCLRAPWIMEKDDFKYSLSFGDDVFGGPDWKTLVPKADAARYAKDGTVPLLRDADGRPLRRNFVHVDDLVGAILAAIDNPRARRQLFNVCMDRPVDYGEVAAYLKQTRGLGSVDIPSEYHSTWLDNAKAKHLLDWQPGGPRPADRRRLRLPARRGRPARDLVPGLGPGRIVGRLGCIIGCPGFIIGLFVACLEIIVEFFAGDAGGEEEIDGVRDGAAPQFVVAIGEALHLPTAAGAFAPAGGDGAVLPHVERVDDDEFAEAIDRVRPDRCELGGEVSLLLRDAGACDAARCRLSACHTGKLLRCRERFRSGLMILRFGPAVAGRGWRALEECRVG